MAGRLAPWNHPAAALAIWSHKLLRWATPLLAVVAVVTALGLAGSGLVLAWLVPAVALGGALSAGLAHLLIGAGRTPPRVIAFARALFVVNAAFGLAWLNVVRRRRIETWRRMEWEATGAVVRRR
jgi:hypothetical protein